MGKGKLILVGSSNPTKINAVKQAFHLVYPKIKFKVVGKGVSSGVSDQPMGEKETFLGANNRVLGLLKDEANYYVGIEGGCCFIDKKLYAFAWVITRDDKKVGCGKTSLFQLPRKIQNLVETGVELKKLFLCHLFLLLIVNLVLVKKNINQIFFCCCFLFKEKIFISSYCMLDNQNNTS